MQYPQVQKSLFREINKEQFINEQAKKYPEQKKKVDFYSQQDLKEKERKLVALKLINNIFVKKYHKNIFVTNEIHFSI